MAGRYSVTKVQHGWGVKDRDRDLVLFTYRTSRKAEAVAWNLNVNDGWRKQQ